MQKHSENQDSLHIQFKIQKWLLFLQAPPPDSTDM